MSAKWSVIAVYADAKARELAMEFCDKLVQRYWPELGFELSWIEWNDLQKPLAAKDARHRASQADMIILATGPEGRLHTHVRSWFEAALRDRGDREGFLVGLPCFESGLSDQAATTQLYLRKLAHDSGLDYLTAVPQNLPYLSPDSAEAYQNRATQVTSVLDTILRRPLVPPRLY